MFCCWGHSMSQIHIFFFALYSSVKSGLLAILVLLRWNSKSHTSFPISYSSFLPFLVPDHITTDQFVFLHPRDCYDHQCSIIPWQVLAVCQDIESNKKMFNGFISFVTYSAASVLNQSSCCFLPSCLHHLF